MQLLQLNQYPGLLDHVLSFVGRGREYCLALASKEAFTTVAQSTEPENEEDFSAFLATVPMMMLPELKNALRQ